MKENQAVSVLFVCMGNICRSPTAEGVFRHKVNAAGLQDTIKIESAGTHAYHVGEPPDGRSQQVAIKRGFDLSKQRARKVNSNDFSEFDYVFAMDMNNEEDLHSICPAGMEDKVHLFLKFALNSNTREVPDPYYGRGDSGFEKVLDLIEDASEGLLAHLKTQHSI
jgi:protein-tyrosine phosphatase